MALSENGGKGAVDYMKESVVDLTAYPGNLVYGVVGGVCKATAGAVKETLGEFFDASMPRAKNMLAQPFSRFGEAFSKLGHLEFRGAGADVLMGLTEGVRHGVDLAITPIMQATQKGVKAVMDGVTEAGLGILGLPRDAGKPKEVSRKLTGLE